MKRTRPPFAPFGPGARTASVARRRRLTCPYATGATRRSSASTRPSRGGGATATGPPSAGDDCADGVAADLGSSASPFTSLMRFPPHEGRRLLLDDRTATPQSGIILDP